MPSDEPPVVSLGGVKVWSDKSLPPGVIITVGPLRFAVAPDVFEELKCIAGLTAPAAISYLSAVVRAAKGEQNDSDPQA